MHGMWQNSYIKCVNLTVVGNKDDDPSRKVVLTQDAKQFADQIGIQLFETSAKDNKNVEEVRTAVHAINSASVIVMICCKKHFYSTLLAHCRSQMIYLGSRKYNNGKQLAV